MVRLFFAAVLLMALAGCQSDEDSALESMLLELSNDIRTMETALSTPGRSTAFEEAQASISIKIEQFSVAHLGDPRCAFSADCIAASDGSFEDDRLRSLAGVLHRFATLQTRYVRSDFIDTESRAFLRAIAPLMAESSNRIARPLIHNYIEPASCRTINEMDRETTAEAAEAQLDAHIEGILAALMSEAETGSQEFRVMSIVPLGRYDTESQSFEVGSPAGQWSIFRWSGTVYRETYSRVTNCRIEPSEFRYSFNIRNASQVFGRRLEIDADRADDILVRAENTRTRFGRHLIGVFAFDRESISRVRVSAERLNDRIINVEMDIEASRLELFMPPRDYDMEWPLGALGQAREIVLRDGPFRSSERQVGSLIPITEPMMTVELAQRRVGAAPTEQATSSDSPPAPSAQATEPSTEAPAVPQTTPDLK